MKKKATRKFEDWQERENTAGGLDNSELLEEVRKNIKREVAEERRERLIKHLIEEDERLIYQERLNWEKFLLCERLCH